LPWRQLVAADTLNRLAGNGVCTIIVESPDRFASDLAVQFAGRDRLRKLGVTLIPATAPDFFTEDTPTAVLVRQVLGAIAQSEKFVVAGRRAASWMSRHWAGSAAKQNNKVGRYDASNQIFSHDRRRTWMDD
jgi:DNA invertase Pin-like site-specific DNA recombinase